MSHNFFPTMQYLRIACSRKAFVMAAAMACLMQSPALAQDTRLSQPAESTGNNIRNEYIYSEGVSSILRQARGRHNAPLS